MSEKGAKKKDAKPVIISGTSKKPLLNDEPINMADTNEYVMHYTGIDKCLCNTINNDNNNSNNDGITQTTFPLCLALWPHLQLPIIFVLNYIQLFVPFPHYPLPLALPHPPAPLALPRPPSCLFP